MAGSAARADTSRPPTVPYYGALSSKLAEAICQLAGLAAKVLRTPIALVAFRGTESCRLSSRRWPGIDELTADPLFAAHVLGSDCPLVVGDACKDRRFIGSLLSQHPVGLRS